MRNTSRRRRLTTLTGATVAGVVVLAGCSSGGSNAGSGGTGGDCTPAGKNTTLHLAFIYSTTSQDPFQEMAMGASYAAKQDGHVDLTESAPSAPDGPKEVADFESAIHTSTDGIAMETVAPNLFVRPLNQATKAGIPLVAVDTPAPKGTDVPLFVGNSNYNIGADLGKAFVAQHPDPKGTVVLGNDIPTLSVLVNRMKGLQATIKKDLPHMKIVGPVDTKNGTTETFNAWNALVHKYSDAEAFIGVGSVDGVALPQIKQKTGRKFLAGSADVPPQALQNVKDGTLFALSSPEHWMKGYIAMHELIHHARSCKPIPKGWWDTGNLLITKKNIDQMITRQKSAASRAKWFMKHDVPKQLANPPIKPISKAN